MAQRWRGKGWWLWVALLLVGSRAEAWIEVNDSLDPRPQVQPIEDTDDDEDEPDSLPSSSLKPGLHFNPGVLEQVARLANAS